VALSDPLTVGVTDFYYGYGYGVAGGTALFEERDPYLRTFMAYAGVVPEPGTLALFGLGIAVVAIRRCIQRH
jgi:hypothetical protein